MEQGEQETHVEEQEIKDQGEDINIQEDMQS